MDPVCHRCGNSLHEGEGFCPHCGAQQLVVDSSETAGPQQPPQRLGIDPSRVQWRVAITSALLVAVPVGLLSALAGMSSLFVIAGGFATIALYRKRSEAFTDGSIGWRVGAILGTASATIATAVYAAKLEIVRYVLHEGPILDREFQAAAQASVDYVMKVYAQPASQSPEFMQGLQRMAGFMLSPDGRAASQLGTAFVMSLGMVLFAATGGAIAGRILSMRPRPQRTL